MQYKVESKDTAVLLKICPEEESLPCSACCFLLSISKEFHSHVEGGMEPVALSALYYFQWTTQRKAWSESKINLKIDSFSFTLKNIYSILKWTVIICCFLLRGHSPGGMRGNWQHLCVSICPWQMRETGCLKKNGWHRVHPEISQYHGELHPERDSCRKWWRARMAGWVDGWRLTCTHTHIYVDSAQNMWYRVECYFSGAVLYLWFSIIQKCSPSCKINK